MFPSFNHFFWGWGCEPPPPKIKRNKLHPGRPSTGEPHLFVWRLSLSFSHPFTEKFPRGLAVLRIAEVAVEGRVDGERWQTEVYGAPLGGDLKDAKQENSWIWRKRGPERSTKFEVRDGSGEGLQQVESILFHNIPMCHMLGFNNPCRRPKKSLCQLCSCYCISCRRNYACEHFFPRNMTLTSLERVFSGCLSRSHWRWQNALCKIGGTRRIRDFRPLINHGPSPSCTSLPSMAIHTGCSIKK